jgi:branched-chain amino acid transport system permease protein
MIEAIVLGLISGLGVGLLATGVVLVYKANRFINLAHGQLGVVPAMILAKFVIQWGWSWWLALPVCLLIGVGAGLLLERALIRPLLASRTSSSAMLLLTIGVSQVLLALTYVGAFGPSRQELTRLGYPVPFRSSFTVGSLVLTSPYLLVLLVCPAVIVGLALFLKLSVTGKRIRAAASNRDGARLLGISVGRTSAITWGIAGGLATLGAILEAPARGSFNDPAFGPELLLRAPRVRRVCMLSLLIHQLWVQIRRPFGYQKA